MRWIVGAKGSRHVMRPSPDVAGPPGVRRLRIPRRLRVPRDAAVHVHHGLVPGAAQRRTVRVPGHMHSRGTSFEAHATSKANGEVRPLYSSDTWDEPAQLEFAPPLEMRAGDALGYSCSYDNRTGMALSYGNSAATNEMCN